MSIRSSLESSLSSSDPFSSPLLQAGWLGQPWPELQYPSRQSPATERTKQNKNRMCDFTVSNHINEKDNFRKAVLPLERIQPRVIHKGFYRTQKWLKSTSICDSQQVFFQFSRLESSRLEDVTHLQDNYVKLLRKVLRKNWKYLRLKHKPRNHQCNRLPSLLPFSF